MTVTTPVLVGEATAKVMSVVVLLPARENGTLRFVGTSPPVVVRFSAVKSAVAWPVFLTEIVAVKAWLVVAVEREAEMAVMERLGGVWTSQESGEAAVL
ncbi:MAG: hypothetical protein FD127_4535, partial [Acidimicrobiaceae bacterium]